MEKIKIEVKDNQEQVDVCIVKCSTQTSGGIQSIQEGTDIEVDNTDPLNPIVSYIGAAVGGVQSVNSGTDISVDNTDPLNPIINYTGSGGGGSITPISKTTAELRALIAGDPLTDDTLENGAWYINNDYQTIYAQPDYDVNGDIKSTLVIKTGSVEPLLLLAISDRSFSSEAYSLNFPKDKLLYDINVDTTFDYNGATNSAATKGRIYERIDENNNRTDFDHRVVKFIRYDDGNGNYTVVNDNGNTALEFLSFDIAQSFDNYFASIYPLAQLVGSEFRNNVFYGLVVDNEFSYNVSNNIFSGNVISNTFSGELNSNIFSEDVNKNTFSGGVNNNTFSGGVSSNTFSGYVNNNTFSGEVLYNTFSGEVKYNTFSGNVTSSIFSGDVSSNIFSGDVNNNTFSGDVNNNTFSGDVSSNIFSGNVNNNTFTHTSTLQYVTIECLIQNETITEVLYPILFGPNYHKIIAIDLASGDLYVKAENSNASGGGVTLHSQLTLDDGTNPHGTTKTDVGLGNVPNTDFTSAVAANTAKVSYDGSPNKRLVNATTSGTFNLNHFLYSDWKLTLTGATTLTDSNLPTGDYTIEFTMKITGSFGLTLPSYWSVNGDTYDGTKWNFFAIQVHKGDVGSEEVTVFITNLA